MAIFFFVFVFILGSAIGSFLGVIVDRLSSSESIWKGRSHCDHCRHMLHVFDLIPVFSYFFLHGKCRYCHKKLSWFYPLIELLTAFAYVASFSTLFFALGLTVLQFPYSLLLLYYFVLTGALIVIFFADVRYGIIPFKSVIVALVATVFWYFLRHLLILTPGIVQVFGLSNLLFAILSAVGAGGFFFLLFMVTNGRGMGFGDVIYAFMMGFILGFPGVFLGLYIAFVTGALVSLILVAMKKKQLKGGTIPFGPFLVLGTLVSLLWGNIIITYIMRYFIY